LVEPIEVLLKKGKKEGEGGGFLSSQLCALIKLIFKGEEGEAVWRDSIRRKIMHLLKEGGGNPFLQSRFQYRVVDRYSQEGGKKKKKKKKKGRKEEGSAQYPECSLSVSGY